jgi:hypothetical protein
MEFLLADGTAASSLRKKVIEGQSFQRADVAVFFEHDLPAFVGGFAQALAGDYFAVIGFTRRQHRMYESGAPANGTIR